MKTISNWINDAAIDADTLHAGSVYHAIELDADCDSMMLEQISNLIQAVRDNAAADDIARIAREISDEYGLLAQLQEFECNPVKQLMDARLDGMPLDGMARA